MDEEHGKRDSESIYLLGHTRPLAHVGSLAVACEHLVEECGV